MRVLVADDDPTTLRLVRHNLESFGYEVVAHPDGELAWAEFQRTRFPVVISDWDMPGLDGVELCRLIRKASLQSYTYIVLLTSRRDHAHLIEGLSSGADDYISKPFHPDELRVRLNAAERIIQLESDLRDVNRELRRMNQKLMETSRLDPLMEIGNRLAFEEKIDEFHRRAVESGEPYGVVMCDVDRFKKCNDRYGHQTGDQVLRGIAEAVRGCLRTTDSAFRYGGEEIVMLLAHQDLHGSGSAAERVREAVGSLRFLGGVERKNFSITVSCGVASFPVNAEPGGDWRSVLAVADEALYQAKDEGRNRVLTAWPTPESEARAYRINGGQPEPKPGKGVARA